MLTNLDIGTFLIVKYYVRICKQSVNVCSSNNMTGIFTKLSKNITWFRHPSHRGLYVPHMYTAECFTGMEVEKKLWTNYNNLLQGELNALLMN